MSTRLTSAIVLGLAIIAGPMSGSVLAQATTTAAVTPASLAATIRTAATGAAAKSHTVVRNGVTVTVSFANLTATEKSAVLEVAISAALGTSGASPAQMATALSTAATTGVIPAGLAVAVAANVAPQLATQVAANVGAPAPTATAATTGDAPVSVLTNLQSAPGAAGPEAPAPVVTAPYDPCAGVVAAYCG